MLLWIVNKLKFFRNDLCEKPKQTVCLPTEEAEDGWFDYLEKMTEGATDAV